MFGVCDYSKIYCEAFGQDDADFRNELFENCFEYVRLLEDNGEILSMLFNLPCKIVTDSTEFKAGYIYAAATPKKHRLKGYMSQLLKKVKNNFNGVLFLRPANKGLIEFYRKNGFKEITGIGNKNGFPLVEPCENFAKLVQNNSEETNEKFTLMYYSKENINLENLHFIYSME